MVAIHAAVQRRGPGHFLQQSPLLYRTRLALARLTRSRRRGETAYSPPLQLRVKQKCATLTRVRYKSFFTIRGKTLTNASLYQTIVGLPLLAPRSQVRESMRRSFSFPPVLRGAKGGSGTTAVVSRIMKSALVLRDQPGVSNYASHDCPIHALHTGDRGRFHGRSRGVLRRTTLRCAAVAVCPDCRRDAQVETIVKAIDKDLADESDYTPDHQNRIFLNAHTLIVLGRTLADHDEDHAMKQFAPGLIAEAAVLADSVEDYAQARQALAAVKSALEQPAGVAADADLAPDLEALMKQVPIVNNSLPRRDGKAV